MGLRNKRSAFLVFVGVFCVALTGCEQDLNPNKTSATGPQKSNPPPGAAPVQTGFYVEAIVPPYINSYFHEKSGYTSPCVVSPTETNPAKLDLTCYLDMMEEDIAYQGFTFHYNVPSSMCSYVAVNPYSYYANPGGIGANSITICTDSTGNLLQASPAAYVTAGSNVVCPLDYTGTQGPNCCEGSYTKIVQVSSNGLVSGCATPTSTTTSTNSYGGKRGNCISGPGADSASGKDKYTGIPMSYIYDTYGTGINFTFQVKAPLTQGHLASNIYAANYFDPADTGNKPPLAVDTTRNAGGTNPYYEFVCLDQAYEYLARIRVLVKSWDYAANFKAQTNYYTPPLPPPPPGGTPAPEPNFPPLPIHDKTVWKDLLDTFPGFD